VTLIRALELERQRPVEVADAPMDGAQVDAVDGAVPGSPEEDERRPS
jgi:hypothetical protein